MSKLIQATIEIIDGENAVLKFDDDTSTRWPTKHLPDGVTQGSIVHMLASDEHAKTILNELLEEES
ncbi:MAG: hypothetical protein WC495_06030 [Patescibacteria group bacterium]|jgi:hypothetical protein